MAEVSGGRMARTEADRRIGLLYLAAGPHIEASNLERHDWVEQKLGLPLKRVQERARLPNLWPEFLAAHEWLVTEGEPAGWPVENIGGGARYAVEAIKLHKRHLKGATPEEAAGKRQAAREAKRSAPAKESAAALRERVSDLEEQVEHREADIERLEKDVDASASALLTRAEAAERRAEAERRRANAAEALLRKLGHAPPQPEDAEAAPTPAAWSDDDAGPPPAAATGRRRSARRGERLAPPDDARAGPPDEQPSLPPPPRGADQPEAQH